MDTLPTSSPLALALDIGSSSVRAIIFDIDGTPRTTAQIKYDHTTTHDGGVQVDAEMLTTVTVECLEQLVEAAGELLSSVKCVGVSCFWHSLMGVDENFCATTPVYSWADTRASMMVSRLKEHLDGDEYHKRTGCELHPCFWPAKLLWLRDAFPELVAKTKRWTGFGEYLFYRLFGKYESSLSMVSATGLFNQQTLDWDDNLLKIVAVTRDALGAIPDYSPVSSLTKEFRGRLPALATIPWYPAVGDGACSNIGSGGTDDHRIVLNVGTSAAMRVVAPMKKTQQPSITKGLFCYRVDRTRIVVGGAFANGGNVYAWLKDVFGWVNDSEIENEMAKIAADSHGLTVLPFWSGERSPGWHSSARSSILGMNLHTTRTDIVRASLESCAYSFDVIRLKLREQFPDANVIAASGGAIEGSPLFARILCDVFGEPVTVTSVAEASARGAALLALHAAGILPSLSDIPVQKGQIYTPNPASSEAYHAAKHRYNGYYERLIDV